MASALCYTGFWIPSNSIPDYLEYVFPSDEDFEPALKKRRLEQENASNMTPSVWPTHEPQYCDLQGPIASVLQPQKQVLFKPSSNETLINEEINLKEDGSNEINKRETRLKKDDSTEQQEHSPTWEDFFQYMESHDPDLVAEPVTLTNPVAEPVNFTGDPVVSPKHKRGHRSRAQSTMVVQGNKVRYSCNICTKTFPTTLGLKLHKHTHKTQAFTEISCNICTKTFSTTRGFKLDQHKHNTHEMKKTLSANTKISPHGYHALTENHQHHLGHKPFRCPLCDRGFKVNQHRLVHLVTRACTRADRLLRYIKGGWECTTCNKLYSSRDQAVRHTRRHQNGYRLTCPVCQKDFTGYKSNILVRHVKNTHPEYLDNL